MGPLKRWHAGDLITHGRLNKMQARAELAARVRGSGATTVGVSTTGVRVGTPYAAKALPFLLQAGLTYVASTWQPPYTDGAQALHYNPATGTYSPEAGRTARLYHPLGARDGNNVYLPVSSLASGMVVYAAWNRQSGRWEIVAPEATTEHACRFELYENLSFGGQATAKLVYWDGNDYAVNDDVTFQVYDAFNKFNQNCKPTGQGGARGYARYFSDAGRWEITELEHQARWIKCLIDNGSGYATTDETWTVDGVVYYDGYEPDTPVTTVYNAPAHADYIFEGDDNDVFYAKYDPAADKYWLDQGECP